MKKLVVFAAALAAFSATPALANEGRADVVAGLAFGGGSELYAGIAGGYDFDLGSTTFAGAEASADKIFNGSKILWGVGGRFGVKMNSRGKLYAKAGVNFGGGSELYLGAGYQLKFNDSLYGKVEYRHTLGGSALNFLGVGVGTTF